MMTLMLAFFVLLVAISAKDERKTFSAMSSLGAAFGHASDNLLVQTQGDPTSSPEAGPLAPSAQFGSIRRLLDAELKGDVSFTSNVFVQVISISDYVFFQPGETGLTPQGKKVLDYLLPLIISVRHPVLIAGHAGAFRDEASALPLLPEKGELDGSWAASLERASAIYRYLLERGVEPSLLRVEAFGRFRPKFTEDTSEGRRRNRRVDLAFDKRNSRVLDWLEPAKAPEDQNNARVHDFNFDVRVPKLRPEAEEEGR
jgi:chemotaxis protein MotB